MPLSLVIQIFVSFFFFSFNGMSYIKYAFYSICNFKSQKNTHTQKNICSNSLVVISYGLVHSSDLSSVIKKIKGLSRGHLLLPKGRIDYMSRVLGSCLSNLFLKISSYGDFITSLGNLCQGITILIIRKLFFPLCRIIYWKIYHSC